MRVHDPARGRRRRTVFAGQRSVAVVLRLERVSHGLARRARPRIQQHHFGIGHLGEVDRGVDHDDRCGVLVGHRRVRAGEGIAGDRVERNRSDVRGVHHICVRLVGALVGPALAEVQDVVTVAVVDQVRLLARRGVVVEVDVGQRRVARIGDDVLVVRGLPRREDVLVRTIDSLVEGDRRREHVDVVAGLGGDLLAGRVEPGDVRVVDEVASPGRRGSRQADRLGAGELPRFSGIEQAIPVVVTVVVTRERHGLDRAAPVVGDRHIGKRRVPRVGDLVLRGDGRRRDEVTAHFGRRVDLVQGDLRLVVEGVVDRARDDLLLDRVEHELGVRGVDEVVLHDAHLAGLVAELATVVVVGSRSSGRVVGAGRLGHGRGRVLLRRVGLPLELREPVLAGGYGRGCPGRPVREDPVEAGPARHGGGHRDVATFLGRIRRVVGGLRELAHRQRR